MNLNRVWDSYWIINWNDRMIYVQCTNFTISNINNSTDYYFLLQIFFFVVIASVYSAPYTTIYPDGVNPSLCPNYPFCDISGVPVPPVVAPLEGFTTRLYPAGVESTLCPGNKIYRFSLSFTTNGLKYVITVKFAWSNWIVLNRIFVNIFLLCCFLH